MNSNQRAIQEICPFAWNRFVEWTKKEENLLAEQTVFTNDDFRILAGFYIDFFLPYAHLSKGVRHKMMEFSIIDPEDVQRSNVNELFVKLESYIRTEEGYKEKSA